MKLLIVTLLGLLGFSSAVIRSVEDEFKEFKSLHNKVYESLEEENLRKVVFRENLNKIRKHNARRMVSWTMKVTEFADLTEEEFRDRMLGGYVKTPSSQSPSRASKVSVADLPESVDWRDQGVITDVKNQGSCGSCWAFATVEQIESYVALNNVTVPQLSTQEVTTCTPNTLSCGGTGGCKGSIPQLGFNYVQLFGLTTEKEYPYWSGVTGMTGRCKYDLEGRAPVAIVSGFDTLPRNDIGIVMEHLANVGPLAIAGDASPWQFYGHGVFDSCSYDSNIELNHAIQLVGYGTDPSLGDYWLVRNSWGSNWGEHGYIRLKRESELTCGLDTKPMNGLACQGGPGNDVQHVCGMCGILYDSSYPLGARAFP